MALFLNPRKKLARDTAQHLVSGHLTLTVLWTLKYAGVLEALHHAAAQPDGLNPAAHAARTNMAPDILVALLNYLLTQGLVEKRGAGFVLSPVGQTLLEYEEGLLDLIRAYQPLTGALEHLLAKLKTYGQNLSRKNDAYVSGLTLRYASEVFPEIARAVAKTAATCLLDLSCGTGELLVHLAQSNRRIVGVGLGADPVLVRQANDLIAQNNLEKRLIAVPARLEETCADTRHTFERAGISQQLWSKIDGLLACNAFTDLAGQSKPKAATALAALAKAFPAAHLLLAEPTAGLRFDRTPNAPELDLLFRLTHTEPQSPETWRTFLTDAGWQIAHESPLPTDALTLFSCPPRRKPSRA